MYFSQYLTTLCHILGLAIAQALRAVDWQVAAQPHRL